ncbi:unnamed protein product [Effrenium voratum]|nr:unnamed protein product [Effrenium voratum]
MRRVLGFALAAAANAELDLGNWMGQLGDVIGKASLLDLSLPGTHDSMTYDLSDTLAEHYEGMSPALSELLHTLTPGVAGKFIRTQGQTQGISVTDMLDGGIRFIDFRIMFTPGPDKVFGHEDWYCLHGCESRLKAIQYLQQVKTWLEAHPKEVVLLWASRHGNPETTGTDQYPGTTPAQRQKFFGQVQDVFGGLLFNSSQRLNETSISSLQASNQRVIWFAADYAESTKSSPLAVDARSIDNQLLSSGRGVKAAEFMRQGAAKLAASKAQDKFLLVSLAGGSSETAIESAAKIHFLPDVFGTHKKWTKECAESGQVPNMTWCPKALMDWGLLSNYYNQRVLDLIYSAGGNADFPNAIYIDAVDLKGLIRTGTDKINPKAALAGDSHGAEGYAYAATLVAANVRRLCRSGCEAQLAMAEAARNAHPLSLWEDPAHGRLQDWPSLASHAIEGQWFTV